MKTIRILIADDHTIVRQGFKALLETIPGFEVVVEASDGAEAVDQIDKVRPDIALMDIMMPNLNGLEATEIATRRKLGTKILILSMHANSTYAVRALKNGAQGYVLKDADQDEIVTAIRTVMSGSRYISPKISDEVLTALIEIDQTSDNLLEELTPRERQILQMIAEGNSNREIAEYLTLSVRTVETHRFNLMAKLKIDSQAKLIYFAIQSGLVSLDPPID